MINRKNTKKRNTKKKNLSRKRGGGTGNGQIGEPCHATGYSSSSCLPENECMVKELISTNGNREKEFKRYMPANCNKRNWKGKCEDNVNVEGYAICQKERPLYMKTRDKAYAAKEKTVAVTKKAGKAMSEVGSTISKSLDDAGRLTQAGRMSTKEEVISLGSFFLSVFKRCKEDQKSDVKYGNNFLKNIILTIMPENAPEGWETWKDRDHVQASSLLLLSKIFASTERRDKKSYQTIINALFEGENDWEVEEKVGTVFDLVINGNKQAIREELDSSDEEFVVGFQKILEKYGGEYNQLNGLRVAFLRHLSKSEAEEGLSQEFLGITTQKNIVSDELSSQHHANSDNHLPGNVPVNGGKRKNYKNTVKRNRK